MQIAETGQPRHLLVQTRIVLHGAGAQRIEPAVDGIVHARQPHIMAHHFGFAQTRQTNFALAALAAQAFLGYLHMGHVDADRAMAQFEDQRFFVIKPAIAGNGAEFFRRDGAGSNGAAAAGFVGGRRAALIVHAHYKPSCSAEVRAAKSSSVLVSVAARISRLATPGSCGSRREAGTPAITPLAAN